MGSPFDLGPDPCSVLKIFVMAGETSLPFDSIMLFLLQPVEFHLHSVYLLADAEMSYVKATVQSVSDHMRPAFRLMMTLFMVAKSS